jgi:hypothetical protein
VETPHFITNNPTVSIQPMGSGMGELFACSVVAEKFDLRFCNLDFKEKE